VPYEQFIYFFSFCDRGKSFRRRGAGPVPSCFLSFGPGYLPNRLWQRPSGCVIVELCATPMVRKTTLSPWKDRGKWSVPSGPAEAIPNIQNMKALVTRTGIGLTLMPACSHGCSKQQRKRSV